MSASLTQSDDFGIEQQRIDRARRMGESLWTQGQQVPQGRMVGRVYVAANPLEHLAQGLRAYSGKKWMDQADSDSQALATKQRSASDAELTRFLEQSQGKPAQTIQSPVTHDDEGNRMPEAKTAAIPPDRMAALVTALRSRNPALQSMGSKMYERDAAMADMQSVLGLPGGQPAAEGASVAQPQGGDSGMVSGVPPQAHGGTAAGSNLHGVNPAALALALRSGDPSKVAQMIQEASKPIALREGDLVVPNGRGGFESRYSQPKLDPGMRPIRSHNGDVTGAEAIPGYAEGVGAITGAKEGAKAGYEMVTVETPDGPRMMTRQQAAQLSGVPAPGSQPRAQPQPSMPPRMQPGSQPPARGVAPQASAMQPAGADADRAAIYRQEMQQAQQRLAAAQTPEEQARARRDVDGLTREMGRIGIPLQDEASKQFNRSLGTESAKTLMESREKATTAVQDILSVAEARKAVQGGAYQGSGANAKLALVKFINANVPGVQIDPTKAGNTDYLLSQLGNGVLAHAKSLGANPSNADREAIEKIIGNLSKDPQAMNQILDFREAMALRAIDNHNRMARDAESRGMRAPFDMNVNQPTLPKPGRSGPSGAGKPTTSNW